ncbi:MAG: family 14 glycosylhydrolase [Armatimonadetes bacterium]|nr:family 14 glycosylhydrolase [Armatimonadota bacterium]
MIKITYILIALTTASLAASESTANKQKMNLPIITGNFSVLWIQHSPVGAFPDPAFNGEPVPPAENWSAYAKTGIKAYEDYVAWGAVEREPGKWDWSRQIEVAKKQNAGGLEYDPYLWLQNPPAWMREGKLPNEPDAPSHFTMMKCLEHDEETYTFSIWDPATLKWFDRFYKEMSKALGGKIGRTYVGLVGPYGEGNYPLPIPDWVKIGHCHEGYWCGDKYARKAFCEDFQKHYRSLESLNKAWGTNFRKWEDLEFPPEIKAGRVLKAEERNDPKSRRRWVDFIKWYHQSIIDFSVEVAKIACRYFPPQKLKMKPGGSAGGVNPIAWGTYCPGYAKAIGELKVRSSNGKIRLQPADCHGKPFGDRWYGTAYRFYGIPLTTEPAGGLDRRTFLRRVFMDASNGATEMFSYEWDKHKLDGLRWIHLYRGIPSITDVAVYCPTTWYRMNGDLWPAIHTADSLRDITDFEVADELLIEDGYLENSKIRVLIWLQGSVVERTVMQKIVKWIKSGGILVAGMPKPPTDVEGRDDLGIILSAGNRSSSTTAETTIFSLGKGLIIRYSKEPKPKDQTFRELVYKAVYHPEQFKPGLKGAPEIDGKSDGVWTAVFPDMLLLYNNNDKPVDVEHHWCGQIIKCRIIEGELIKIPARK